LLGFDKKDYRGPHQNAQTEEWMEELNNDGLEKIGSKVSTIKELSLGVRNEIKDSTDVLSQLESGMYLTGGMLKGSMGRLSDMTQSATKKHMLYLVLFIVGLFLALYYGLSFF